MMFYSIAISYIKKDSMLNNVKEANIPRQYFLEALLLKECKNEKQNPHGTYYLLTCRKMVMLSFPSLLSHLSNAWQAFSMSRKDVTGSLLIAKTMSPCSNKFSAFDPAKQPFTRKTCRLIGSFLTSAFKEHSPTINYKNNEFGNQKDSFKKEMM